MNQTVSVYCVKRISYRSILNEPELEGKKTSQQSRGTLWKLFHNHKPMNQFEG